MHHDCASLGREPEVTRRLPVFENGLDIGIERRPALRHDARFRFRDVVPGTLA
jgi:hypothetical protein